VAEAVGAARAAQAVALRKLSAVPHFATLGVSEDQMLLLHQRHQRGLEFNELAASRAERLQERRESAKCFQKVKEFLDDDFAMLLKKQRRLRMLKVQSPEDLKAAEEHIKAGRKLQDAAGEKTREATKMSTMADQPVVGPAPATGDTEGQARADELRAEAESMREEALAKLEMAESFFGGGRPKLSERIAALKVETTSWVKKGVLAMHDGKLGTVTMDIDRDGDIQLQFPMRNLGHWASNQGHWVSPYIKAVELTRPPTSAEIQGDPAARMEIDQVEAVVEEQKEAEEPEMEIQLDFRTPLQRAKETKGFGDLGEKAKLAAVRKATAELNTEWHAALLPVAEHNAGGASAWAALAPKEQEAHYARTKAQIEKQHRDEDKAAPGKALTGAKGVKAAKTQDRIPKLEKDVAAIKAKLPALVAEVEENAQYREQIEYEVLREDPELANDATLKGLLISLQFAANGAIERGKAVDKQTADLQELLQDLDEQMDAAFKKTWRKFVSRNHPDRAMAAGRPAMATADFQAAEEVAQKLMDTVRAAHQRPWGFSY
jgi:hypothetical protein